MFARLQKITSGNSSSARCCRLIKSTRTGDDALEMIRYEYAHRFIFRDIR